MKWYHLVMAASLVVAVTPQRNNNDTLGLHANTATKRREANETVAAAKPKRNIAPGITKKEAGRELLIGRDTPKRLYWIDKAEREVSTKKPSKTYWIRRAQTSSP